MQHWGWGVLHVFLEVTPSTQDALLVVRMLYLCSGHMLSWDDGR